MRVNINTPVSERMRERQDSLIAYWMDSECMHDSQGCIEKIHSSCLRLRMLLNASLLRLLSLSMGGSINTFHFFVTLSPGREEVKEEKVRPGKTGGKIVTCISLHLIHTGRGREREREEKKGRGSQVKLHLSHTTDSISVVVSLSLSLVAGEFVYCVLIDSHTRQVCSLGYSVDCLPIRYIIARSLLIIVGCVI